MIRKLRKGFTIVELVIVISVIAVLTAVLIPTFVHLSKKANKASDNSLVANLNTALAMEASESGKAPKTMHDAVQGLENQGYKLPQLVTKSGEELVYNIAANKFYLSGDKELEGKAKIDYWHIQDEISSSQEWSIYAFNWKGETKVAGTSESPLGVGFDAGVEPVSSVYFGGSLNALIRTNGGELTINAPEATVSHHGKVDSVNIIAVKGESYHEYGEVGKKLVLAKGHVVVEQTGLVPEVSVESATGAVKVTANAETTVVVDSTSASQTSVVANSTNVFVDGVEESKISGSQASTVVKPSEVLTESDLRGLASGSAKLGADIVISTDEPIVISGKAALNLNGHNISFAAAMGDETSLYQVAKTGYLSVSGSGKITANARMFEVAGKLRVEGGTFVTTVLANSAKYRSTIISAKESLVTINGGDFYSAKANAFTEGDLVINGGSFTSIANTSFARSDLGASDPYAYVILPSGKTTINGGQFFGVHGGLCQQGGNLEFNNGYFEVSNKAFERFGAVETQVHYLDHKEVTKTIATTDTVGGDKMYYAAYVAGESFSVTATFNGGEFVNKGNLYAVHVGNSTYGDGGERLPAFVSIKGGKYVSEVSDISMSIDKYVGTCQVSGGNYNREQIKAGGTKMNLSAASKVLVSGYGVVAEGDGTWSVKKN